MLRRPRIPAWYGRQPVLLNGALPGRLRRHGSSGVGCQRGPCGLTARAHDTAARTIPWRTTWREYGRGPNAAMWPPQAEPARTFAHSAAMWLTCWVEASCPSRHGFAKAARLRSGATVGPAPGRDALWPLWRRGTPLPVRSRLARRSTGEHQSRRDSARWLTRALSRRPSQGERATTGACAATMSPKVTT